MSMKLEAALGFCARARKLISGDFAVTKAVNSGKAKVVILDKASSPATVKKWQNSCAYYGVELFFIDEPGIKAGKADKKVFAVTDVGFYNLIKEAYETYCAGNVYITDTDINTGGN